MADLLFDDLLPDSPQLLDGDVVHFLVHLSFLWDSELPITVRPGSTVTVTADMLVANIDRNGVSWLDLVDDSGEQVRRYGRVRFARGPAPEGLLPALGTTDHDDLHKAEHDAAWRLTDPDARAEAVRQVQDRFGTLGHSRTLRPSTS